MTRTLLTAAALILGTLSNAFAQTPTADKLVKWTDPARYSSVTPVLLSAHLLVIQHQTLSLEFVRDVDPSVAKKQTDGAFPDQILTSVKLYKVSVPKRLKNENDEKGNQRCDAKWILTETYETKGEPKGLRDLYLSVFETEPTLHNLMNDGVDGCISDHFSR